MADNTSIIEVLREMAEIFAIKYPELFIERYNLKIDNLHTDNNRYGPVLEYRSKFSSSAFLSYRVYVGFHFDGRKRWYTCWVIGKVDTVFFDLDELGSRLQPHY